MSGELWPSVSLGQVLTLNRDYITTPEHRLYPKLSVKLYGKGVVLDEPVDGATLKMQRHQIARPGQVILSEIWGKKGAIGTVPSEGDGALCTSHFFLFDTNSQRIHADFLRYILTSNYLQPQLEAVAQGSTGYAAVRPKDLLAATIPLPPLDDQRRIVAKLGAVTSSLERLQYLKGEMIAAVNASAEVLHLSAAGDRTVFLSQVLELHEERTTIEHGCIYPQVGVRGFGQGLFPKGTTEAGDTTYRWFNRLYAGAIVLSQVKGWEGAIAGCPADLAGWFVSPEYRTFRCVADQAEPSYLGHIVRTPWFWKQLSSLHRGMGGRRERTRQEQFLGLKIPMPTLFQQRQFLPIFDRLNRAAAIIRVDSDITRLRSLILDRAFSGEL